MRRGGVIGIGWLALATGLCVATTAARASAQAAPLRIGGIDVMRPAPSLLTVGAGVFDVAEEGDRVFDRNGRSAVGKLEYRLGGVHLPIAPTIGVVANHDGGVLGYGGFSFDCAFDRWRFSPLLSAGAYRQGHSKKLGGMFEFQVGGVIAYELADGSRAGLTVTHISNAYTHDTNPGAELIFLSYAIPFGPAI